MPFWLGITLAFGGVAFGAFGMALSIAIYEKHFGD